MNILEKANEIVHGARNEAYGHPLDNHGLTAKYWNVYIEAKYVDAPARLVDITTPLTAEDVCFLNILQKIARAQNGVDLNLDSLTDIAGYSENIEMILEERKTRSETASDSHSVDIGGLRA